MSVLDDLSSYSTTIVRLGRGLYPSRLRGRRDEPKRPLELYEFENCPYCRKVREVLCELDLDYVVRPVAHGSPRRAQLQRLAGKVQVPFLVDPNSRVRLLESEEIVAYLNRQYGGDKPAGWRLPVPALVDNLLSTAASATRPMRGRTCRVQRDAELEPLELYNMEGSPYCRKVREVLSELDLVHLVRNVPKGSPQRAELERRGGKVQVPYLIDPNAGKEMYESDEIVAYLEREYGPRQGGPAGRKK